MITACLIILAWVVAMPLWASVIITVLASVRFIAKFLIWCFKCYKEKNEDKL